MNKIKVICIKGVKYDNCHFIKGDTYVVEIGDKKVFIFGCGESAIMSKREYEQISIYFKPFITNN